MNIGVCHENARCLNKIPGFACDCETGFIGDGIVSCIDIDECEDGFDECHSMATCTNTVGSYTCECIDDWSGNGKVCSEDICSQCDDLASCKSKSDCKCQNGYTGDGYQCSKTNVVIPIFAKPKVTNDECTDSYWLNILNAQRGISLILEVETDESWLPCLRLLRSVGIDIYIKIPPVDSGFSIMPKTFELSEAISDAKESHGSSISGVYLSEPNLDGFTPDDYVSVFSHATENDLLIAIDGHGTKWDIDTVNVVDLIVTFKGGLAAFEDRCSTSLCLQDLDAIDEVLSAIKLGYISRTKFATLIFDVDQKQLDEIYTVLLKHRVSRSIFVTDRSFGDENSPSYFGEMVTSSQALLATTVGERSLNTCGCRDIDECGLGTDICPIHSRCENMDGGYRCYCIDGFTDHVTWSRLTVTNGEFNCVDINECVDNLEICGENTNCINTVGSYECDCISGFARDANGICRDVDECASQLDNCDVLSVCTNLIGSFDCECIAGYEGDGRTNGSGCVDTDECDNHVDECDDIASCTNTPGGYYCTCPVGFSGDGVISSTGCDDVNECESGISNCHIMATCSNTVGSFDCLCVDDWVGNGFACAQDICSICDGSATCSDSTCNCPTGYSGSGFFCPKNSLVIPIKNKPEVTPHSKQCTDRYWSTIASNPDNCVILEDYKPSWRPCVEILSDNNVQIFASLDTSSIAVDTIKVNIYEHSSNPYDFLV